MDDIFTNATIVRIKKENYSIIVGVSYPCENNNTVEEIREVRDDHFLVTFKDSENFLVVNNPDYITYKKGKK